jgi:uncharacterized protein (TIGR01777 family)
MEKEVRGTPMHFVKRTQTNVVPEALYQWHMRPGAFERLTPPWEDVRVLDRRGDPSETGFRVVLSVPLGPARKRWVAEHRDVEPGRMFRDVQIEGPFSRWEHTHRFHESGSGSLLEDEVLFDLPFGRLGRALGGKSATRTLERLFRYRHDTTVNDVETHRRYEALPRMKVLMTGSSGLVGSALRSFLTTGGHEVVRLVRRERVRPESPDCRVWDPLVDVIDLAHFDGIDAVVHLAGESIASGRWTSARKDRIRESRVRGTRLLSESLAKLSVKPKVFLSASAIGFYGDRGSEPLDETSVRGSGFLASVCRDWEQATEPAERAGIRVVHLRAGIVLSPKGGALQRMLPPFRLGLGGRIGSGDQFMSWIPVDEIAAIVLHALATEAVEGPVNAVSPSPVTNREFTSTLARTLKRPALLPVPSFALRAALGEMANELLLSSARVAPKKLLESGYRFRYPELEGALRHLLGRGAWPE